MILVKEKEEELIKKIIEGFIAPHIGWTANIYKAKSSAYIKSLNVDLTLEQFIIVKIISILGEITQNELAVIVEKDKSNLSRMLEVLEKKGFIVRKLGIKDNRAVKILSTSDKSNEVVKQFDEIALVLQEKALKDISKKDLQILKDVLAKIRGNLENIDEGMN